MPAVHCAERKRADETHAVIVAAAAGTLELQYIRDLRASFLHGLLDAAMEGQRRGRAAIARAGETDFDDRRTHGNQFDVAAMRGEHRPHAVQRRFDALAEAGLQDVVASQHSVDDLVARRLLHRLQRRRIGLQPADEPAERLSLQTLDGKAIGFHGAPLRLVPRSEKRLQPFDVADEAGERLALCGDEVDRVHGFLTGSVDP